MSNEENGNSNVRGLMEFVVTEDQRKKTEVAEQLAVKMAIMATLDKLGELTHDTDDGLVFKGDKIVLPAAYEGRVMDAARYLREYHNAQEKHYEFSRSFPYRPLDGAHAFHASLKKLFGSVGIGKNRPATFFSPERPPQMRTIDIGVGKTAQVPWGEVEFPMFNATFHLGAAWTRRRATFSTSPWTRRRSTGR